MSGMTQRRHRRVGHFPKLVGLAALLAGCSGDANTGTARRVTLTARGEDGGPAPLAWVAFQDGDGPGFGPILEDAPPTVGDETTYGKKLLTLSPRP
jgi:hypothetical protein